MQRENRHRLLLTTRIFSHCRVMQKNSIHNTMVKHSQKVRYIVVHRFNWFCQWVCFFLVAFVYCNVAKSDVILWNQPLFSGPTGSTGFVGFNFTDPGQTRSQSIDLSQAAVLHSLSLNLGQPFFGIVGSGSYNISLWLDSTPAERKTLIYSGGFKSSWTGLSVYLPKGRSWLSVENLPTSTTISWGSPSGTTGGAFTSGGVTTLTAAYAGQATGVYVPEPGHLVALLICCATGIVYAWCAKRSK